MIEIHWDYTDGTEAFLNKKDAEDYAYSLQKSNELLENKTRLYINIEKQK